MVEHWGVDHSTGPRKRCDNVSETFDRMLSPSGVRNCATAALDRCRLKDITEAASGRALNPVVPTK